MASADEILHSWTASLSSPATLTLYADDSPVSEEMKQFGLHLAKKTGDALAFEVKKGESHLPFFEASQGIRFFALPGEKLLGLFLYAIQGPLDNLRSQTAEQLSRIELPATLDLFVAEFCPFCPRIARELITLARQHPPLHLSLYDGSLFLEEAEKRGVQSAPTLIYDHDIRWSGQFDVTAAMEVVAGRTPEELSPDAIQALLEEGEAQRVVTMIADAQKPFDSLGTLLTHEKWAVRLGAMVVMESLAESDPAIVSMTAATLLQRRDEISSSALGDIIYIAGLSGDAHHLPVLRHILANSQDQTIREAAEESIETLEDKEA